MNAPKIVLLDIESLPNLPAALEVWPQLGNYPGLTLKASINSIACVGWKIFGRDQDPVSCVHAWDFPAWETSVNDDRALCVALAEILEGADCIVTHNGKKFDFRFIQTRFLFHGLDPIPPIHHVDTCAEAKKHFYFFNNRLSTIARFLTDEEKMEHEGWDLWVAVHARDKGAMQRMSDYCKQDIVVLEEVFRELRPLVTSLPNYNLFSPLKEKCCPKCGSSRLKSNGKRYTRMSSYRRYICEDCRSWCRTDLKDEVPR